MYGAWVLPLLLTAALAAPAPPPLPLRVEERRLANGIRVAAVSVPGSALVSVQVRVAGGTAEERQGEAGFAHLVEHLMFGGSAHAPDGAYDTWLAEVGAENNAWTEHDATTYSVTSPPEALPLVLFLESDRLGWLAGGLSQESLDTQRAVVAAEAAGDVAAPHGRDLAALNRVLFPEGHPYHRPVMGHPADLVAADLSTLLRFHRRTHAPGRVSVAIAGPGEPGDVLALAERWLEDVPQVPSLPLVTVSPTPPAPRGADGAGGVHSWRDRVREDAVFIAWSTVPRGHPDEPSLDLLARWMSEGVAPPLEVDRRLRRAGVRSIEAWTRNGRHGGVFVVEARVSGGDPAAALSALRRAWARAPTPDRGIDALRIGWHADALRGAQGVEALAGLALECMGRGEPAGCAHVDLARYTTVSEASLAVARERWLSPPAGAALLVVDPARSLPVGALPVVLP